MPEKEETKQKQEEQLTDIEIAELANQELRKKNAEIEKLKKDLAKAKLLSTVEPEEKSTLTKEECITRLFNDRTTNYDYAEAVVNLVDIELSEDRPNPLGTNGEEVYNFFKDCLEECGDDKSRFTAVYQAKIGADDAKVAMAYKKRNGK